MIYSGWRMLDNGTYIRVYEGDMDGGSEASTNSGSYQVSSGSSQVSSGSSQVSIGSSQVSSGSSQVSTGSSQVSSGSSQGGSGSSQDSFESSSVISGGGNGNSHDVSLGVGVSGGADASANTIQGSTGGGSGSTNSGWVRQPDGTYVRKSSSWSSWSSGQQGSNRPSMGGLDPAVPEGNIQTGNIHSGSYFQSGARGGASSSRVTGEESRVGGEGGGGGLGTLMGAAVGPGDYHGTMSQAELEREAGGRVFNAGAGTETRGQVDRTQYQGGSGSSIHSSGSSSQYGGSSSQSSGSSSQSAGSSYSQGSSGTASSSSSGDLDANDVVETTGGKWVWSEASQKWEWEAESSGSSQTSSSSEDSGWTMLPNGTWARSSSWSSSTQTQSGQVVGGLATGALLPGEQGHQGRNDTGWVEMPDGTMVKKTSAWASWSGSSYDGMSDTDLQGVQRGLENRVRSQLPGNVEPGYEQQFRSRSRSRRSLAEFESELASCGARCTVIKCTIGPLEKDESVLFKVRSRLFTETQVKNYAEKVRISSKLVTRVTRLPFLVPEEHLSFQSHSVTTTVIPSEPGELGIPWWVWLLAAVGGALLLALITYCLYKCGFFKRHRPEDGPESEPLQSNGY